MVEPLIMVYNTFPANTTTIRIKPHDFPIVKEIFEKIFLHFLSIILSLMKWWKINTGRKTMSLFNDFTILSILISCLGLYGLATLISMQRTKEMGIRKVLGASLGQAVFNVEDFIKLVFWALIIS
jgi:putative ABC transport system permease protein